MAYKIKKSKITKKELLEKGYFYPITKGDKVFVWGEVWEVYDVDDKDGILKIKNKKNETGYVTSKDVSLI
jgi:hypothetical protein